jgi:hypothetical protein
MMLSSSGANCSIRLAPCANARRHGPTLSTEQPASRYKDLTDSATEAFKWKRIRGNARRKLSCWRGRASRRPDTYERRTEQSVVPNGAAMTNLDPRQIELFSNGARPSLRPSDRRGPPKADLLAFTITSACRIAKSSSKPRPLASPCSPIAAAITFRIAASPASIVMSFVGLRSRRVPTPLPAPGSSPVCPLFTDDARCSPAASRALLAVV